MTFGTRLAATLQTHGHLCVGIDPHEFLLEAWGLPVSAAGVRGFGLRVVEATAGAAGIVKPQVAFFERFGSAGLAALEEVLAAARAADLVVIGDAKRGDVGSTLEAYAQAWLTPGSPLEVDAMTVSAYQGLGSLDAAHAFALANGKGLFVLAATSNPESIAGQTARVGAGEYAGQTVAGGILLGVNAWNVAENAALGSTGVVIGATIDLGEHGIEDAALARTPILAPGFGHQGAQLADVRSLYGAAAVNVIVNASRSILAAGPTGISEAIRVHAAETAEAFA